MSKLLVFETILYFGILAIQVLWYAQRQLTERRFAIFQVAPLSLIMITAGLDAYLSSPDPYPFGLIVLSVGTIVFIAIGYPIARWIYRKTFLAK